MEKEILHTVQEIKKQLGLMQVQLDSIYSQQLSIDAKMNDMPGVDGTTGVGSMAGMAGMAGMGGMAGDSKMSYFDDSNTDLWDRIRRARPDLNPDSDAPDIPDTPDADIVDPTLDS